MLPRTIPAASCDSRQTVGGPTGAVRKRSGESRDPRAGIPGSLGGLDPGATVSRGWGAGNHAPRLADNRYHLGVSVPASAQQVSPSWGDATTAALLRKGLRNGGARRAVIDLLAEQRCCLTAQDIFDRLRASGRKVGIASVYRVLELLTSEGFVQRIDLGSGISRYEPIRSGGEHHHHIVCDACGKVEAFEDRALERAIHRVEETSGYAVAAHDVVLHGSCADCR